MKNLINYFYNLIISEFKKSEETFIFDINNTHYEFIPYYDDIINLQKIYNNIIISNRYCNEIVLNKDNQIITLYENKPYILIKSNIYRNTLITIDDIINYNAYIYESREITWKNLWESKIDYYEYQINQFGYKYPIIRESFSYYIGLSEQAITLLNYINTKKINMYISHKRIYYKENMNSFLNPTNIIIDSRVRDISEYIKIYYINEELSIEEIKRIIDNLNLNYDEVILLLSRFLYPSYYFDLYDKIIQEKINEEKLLTYIKKNEYYESFLKTIYKYIRNIYRIPEIEWLEY